MDEQELQKYFEIYTMCWKLFKKYSSLADTDEYWRAFSDELDAIYQRYDKNPLVLYIGMNTQAEIERLIRRSKGVDAVKRASRVEKVEGVNYIVQSDFKAE